MLADHLGDADLATDAGAALVHPLGKGVLGRQGQPDGTEERQVEDLLDG
jgi:hypothetical protein